MAQGTSREQWSINWKRMGNVALRFKGRIGPRQLALYLEHTEECGKSRGWLHCSHVLQEGRRVCASIPEAPAPRMSRQQEETG